jgi:hypothetical protein
VIFRREIAAARARLSGQLAMQAWDEGLHLALEQALTSLSQFASLPQSGRPLG